MMRPSLAIRTSRRLHTRCLHHRCRPEEQQQQQSVSLALLNRKHISSNAAKRKIHIQPLPMPAVAHCDFDVYDDIDDYEYGDGDENDHQASHVNSILASAAGGGSSGRGPNMMGGNNTDNTTSRFVGGPPNGGGGGGHSHHNCPKCGATVTFQDNKGMQNNCFYCAACSGWFLVKPNNTMEMDESKFLLSKMAAAEAAASGEKVVGSPPNRKISQPQFVMQNVSLSLSFHIVISKLFLLCRLLWMVLGQT